MDAHDEVILELLAAGTKVRALGLGYFTSTYRLKSRRLSPITRGYVEVPGKETIVFRTSRRK